MKVNAPKRKVFQDALDLLAEDPVEEKTEPVNGIVSLPVDEIHPFHDHPFRLYEGERLEDTKLCVKEIFVDGGRMLKRIQAAPQGRAHRIRKRSNHVTIVVDKMVTVENK